METQSSAIPTSSASSTIDSFLQWEAEVRHNAVKRGFDIVFSSLAMILGAPIFLIIALAVRLSSPGNVFYAQERVGRGGKMFRCYKFRTMYTDADERLANILAHDPEMNREWVLYQKLKNDPRVTQVGAFLRKISLDELPQFWNVLLGDLSVVGPRPLLKSEIAERLGARAAKILSVRPGLTGLWQVSGRSDISYEKRIDLDEEYVNRCSLWLDIVLILKTIPAMLFPKGAY